MKTYLSIDLDYWSYHKTNEEINIFFKKVFSLGNPITVVLHHHHLLKYINSLKTKLNTVINVDFHSDIVDYEKGLKVDEGTWANFVKFRNKGTFIWHSPITKNRCSYCHLSASPFKDAKVSGWHKVIEVSGLDLPWKSIKAVGVCLSPNWLGRHDILKSTFSRLKLNRWIEDYRVYKRKRGSGFFAPYVVKV